jgi:hypothetical protein
LLTKNPVYWVFWAWESQLKSWLSQARVSMLGFAGIMPAKPSMLPPSIGRGIGAFCQKAGFLIKKRLSFFIWPRL